MAPTIQNGGNPPDKRPQRSVERKSELITRVKYCNSLPDIPFDLKFITYPFQNDRFVQYNPTSLERNYKYEVLTEHDLGVTIDLINRDLYQTEPFLQLDPADEKLLEEDVHTPQDSLRSRHHAKSVSWLRKSEYISTEQTRFQPQNMEKVEAKVGYNVRKSFVEETLYMDRETQVKSIEKTFAENKIEIKTHYSKPNVTAVEVLDIFPDFVNWKYPCAQVIFDSDPAPINKNLPSQIEEMSQAMIRGVMDESGEQFVAYFLPTEDTLEKRRIDLCNEVLYEDFQEYEYKMAREYNWNVKSKASKGYEENYFLVIRNEGVYYNELETRVRLSKRRQNMGQQPNNTKLVVKHIPLNANEHKMQRYREKLLEPAGEEEEEEMDVSEAEEETQEETQNEKAGSETEANNREAEKTNETANRSRSVSKSRSRSRSQSRSQVSNHSGSNRSRSRSRSKSGSRSRTPSRSRSRSRSGSRAATSRSRSGSRHSGSRSRSGSRAATSRSRSGSRHSGSRSRSGSRAATSRSRSGSRHSGSRSRSGSRAATSRSRSGSRHSERSRSGSRKSASPGSRSGSHTPSHSSASGSESGDASD